MSSNDALDDSDRSERLSKEEGDELRNLLLYLRYVMRHQFKAIAQRIDEKAEVLWLITSKRSRGTKQLQQKLFRYAEDRRVPIQIATALGSNHGFRSELNISDEQLSKDAARLAGRYLSYTLLDDGEEPQVGVTLITLYAKEEGDSLPEFAGWRPEQLGEIRNRGYYYEYDGALYMVGHALMTGYPRLTCLEPQTSGGSDAFFGSITSASRDDLSFQSWCCLRKTTSLLQLRRDNWSKLGVFDLSELTETQPGVVKLLKGKQVQRIERRSTFHG